MVGRDYELTTPDPSQFGASTQNRTTTTASGPLVNQRTSRLQRITTSVGSNLSTAGRSLTTQRTPTLTITSSSGTTARSTRGGSRWQHAQTVSREQRNHLVRWNWPERCLDWSEQDRCGRCDARSPWLLRTGCDARQQINQHRPRSSHTPRSVEHGAGRHGPNLCV